MRWVVLSLSVLALAGPSAAQLPTRVVPDTRRFGIRAETTVVRETLRLFGQVFPLEGAVCFYGPLTTDSDGYVEGRLQTVRAAIIDSATSFRVHFPADTALFAGCPYRDQGLPLLAIGHSHIAACTDLYGSVSDADVLLLASADQRGPYASLVFCLLTGRGLVLFPDGRWKPFIFLRATP